MVQCRVGECTAQGIANTAWAFVTVEKSNEKLLTALGMAARKGHIGVIRRLLEAGANPDLADQAGNGPRFYAVRVHVDAMNHSSNHASMPLPTSRRSRR